MFTLWGFLITAVFLSFVGSGVRVLLKHRLELKKLQLEQLEQENLRLQAALEREQKQIQGRVEALETIATGADDQLAQRLKQLQTAGPERE